MQSKVNNNPQTWQDMKKTIFTLVLMTVAFLCLHAQRSEAFTSVPVTNGKVVFERFTHTGTALTVDQKYARWVAWGQGKYVGSPTLSGIRFDDNARTMTVSLRTPLTLSGGETITMIHRFDVSVSNVGSMLTIRDITYQSTNGNSIFPTIYTAEETITDTAIAINDENSARRNQIRTATLVFFNELSAEVDALFR